jgi:hypothetical protein
MKQKQLHKQLEIIASPLVEWLRQQDFPMPQPPIRFYPDGSLWTDDCSVLSWTDEYTMSDPIIRQLTGRECSTFHDNASVAQLIDRKLPGGYTAAGFRPLVPFGGDWDVAPHYGVLYPGSCYKWMGEHELGALMYPGICAKATEDEYDLAHVRVMIRLRRKFSEEVATELAGVLRQWFVDIGSKGVFGEAGLKSISSTMRYQGREAGFELDARGSGQETLNTLYLAVLNWGMNQRRHLVLTDLAADRNSAVFTSDLSIPLL